MTSLEEVPVLYPTLQEFEDPISYLSQPQVQRQGHICGMIKLVPPREFQPPLSIKESTFKFNVRLQRLSELNILNRSRLFFLKQLNNFFMVGSRKNSTKLKLPYAQFPNVKIYYYDLFIEIIKFFNRPTEEENEYTNRSPRKRSRKENLKKSQVLRMVPLEDIISNGKMWKQLSRALNSPIDYLQEVFQSVISKYYSFLHLQSVRFSSDEQDSSFLSKLIYNEEFPLSLLQDIRDNSSDNGEESSQYTDDEEESEEDEDCNICHRTGHSTKSILCDSCDKAFHIFCLMPPLAKVPDGKWICNNCIIGNGYYGFKEEEHFYTKQEFREMCNSLDSRLFPSKNKLDDIQALEKKFWSMVNDMDQSMTVKYGADIHNESPGEITGFPTLDYVPERIMRDHNEYERYVEYARHPMNLLNLPQAKGSLLPVFGKKISGMTVPWIYIGSTFSTFCWHLEDQYTLSANYQHEGDPKVWYSIPEHSCDKFNRLMKDIAPDLFEKQPDLLHQLITLISPYDKRFQQAKISCYKALQKPGEYIITFPKCYHAGFNTGYNFNEAVNFTLDTWLPYGIEACQDYKDTGKQCVFDMWELMLNVLIQYLENKTPFNESLVRRCHLELLNIFNGDVKIIKQLHRVLKKEIIAEGFRRKHLHSFNPQVEPTFKHEKDDKEEGGQKSDDDDDDDDDDGDDDQQDEDVFCSRCRTICPFAFVIHYNNYRTYKRRKLYSNTPSQWNELASRGNFSILCLPDYLKLVETTEEQSGEETDSVTDSDLFEHDELYFIRNPEEVRDILRKSEKRIENMLM